MKVTMGVSFDNPNTFIITDWIGLDGVNLKKIALGDLHDHRSSNFVLPN